MERRLGTRRTPMVMSESSSVRKIVFGTVCAFVTPLIRGVHE
jgi:hypothetical protein